MTLILSVANSRGVFQSSDYRLVEQGTNLPYCNEAGSKQLQVNFKRLRVMLAFTGTAVWDFRPRKERTIDYLFRLMRGLCPDPDLDTVCQTLARECGNHYSDAGDLTMVLSVACIGEPFRVATVSNVVWLDDGHCDKSSNFHVSITPITEPCFRVFGWSPCVSREEIRRLDALSRIADAEDNSIMTRLAEINASAAAKSDGRVSEACFVTSQFGEGDVRRFQTINVGGTTGDVPVMIGSVDINMMLRQMLGRPQAWFAKVLALELSVVKSPHLL
jgi:hypothetical protein